MAFFRDYRATGTLTYKQRFLFISTVPIYFMIFALIFSPIKEILPGLWQIIIQPDLLITDYIVVGGIGAAFFNAGILTLILLFLLYHFKVEFDRHIVVSSYLIFGFSLFGKNVVNIWLILIGFFVYARLHGYSLKKYIYYGLYGTSLSPAITLVMQIGHKSTVWQLLLATVTGLIIGYVLLPISLHVKSAHKGYSLYNVGFSSGIIATVLVSIFKSFGVDIETRLIWDSSHTILFAVALFVLFSYMVVVALILDGKELFPAYMRLLRETGVHGTYKHNYSDAVYIFNMSINGIIATAFVLAAKGDLNGPTIGSIFTIVGFSPAGKHMRNILPVMVGVCISAFLKQWHINDPAPILTLLLSTTLAPIAGEFGVLAGLIAGFLHSSVALNVGIVYRGLNLYNNGFAGGIVAIFMVPVIEAIIEKRNKIKNSRIFMENITDNMIKNETPWNDGIQNGDTLKRVGDSRCEQTYQVSARYLNASGRLFGGDLLSWIDLIGGIAAKRHCNMPVSTVAIDNIHFSKPMYIGDIAVLVANLTHVGNSTMEVRVNSYVEDLATGKRFLVNTAYLVYVALQNDKPHRVPRLIPETDNEKREWFAGETRNEIRKSRRKEGI